MKKKKPTVNVEETKFNVSSFNIVLGELMKTLEWVICYLEEYSSVFFNVFLCLPIASKRLFLFILFLLRFYLNQGFALKIMSIGLFIVKNNCFDLFTFIVLLENS